MKKLKKAYAIPPEFIRSRWFIIGALVLLALGSIGAYIWWSQNSWSDYEKKYRSARQNIDAKLTQAFSLQSDTSDERQQKVTQLAGLSEEIEGINDSFCRQNVFIDWQGAFGEYKAHEESCKVVVASIGAFNDQLRSAVEYLKQEQALARQLGAAPAQAEVAEGDFEGQLAAWRSVYEGFKNASASDDFDSIKQAALSGAEGIVKNGEEVIAAHQAKDKARYLKATQALAAAYDNLQAVVSTNTTRLAEVATRVKEAYSTLQ